jgi:hypothetical protein
MTRHLLCQQGVSRNLVAPETVEHNRIRPGALTFNAPSPNDFEGRQFTLATVRIGDHAHIDCYSGRQNALKDGQSTPTQHRGYAGRLVMAWPDWALLRDSLATTELPQFLIREVENPTKAQLDTHVG